MEILHFCPANLATGGTEGIHHLVSELRKCGADAKILYSGGDLTNPQPPEYTNIYDCPYVTEIPVGYKGVIIFPEVWGNRVTLPIYKDVITVINWQGVDVYYWNNPRATHHEFLKNPNTIHITMSEYGINHLRNLGLDPIKVPDLINEDFFQDFSKEYNRKDVVLYNPVQVKLTKFQQIVMARCTTELGIKFLPVENYTRSELIDLFRKSKLYIDFGQFSGRERLPREAVMCGCCIITSRSGTAGYYWDNAIPNKYKIADVDDAINMIQYVLRNYDQCRSDFEVYKQIMQKDRDDYPKQVKELYEILEGL